MMMYAALSITQILVTIGLVMIVLCIWGLFSDWH